MFPIQSNDTLNTPNVIKNNSLLLQNKGNEYINNHYYKKFTVRRNMICRKGLNNQILLEMFCNYLNINIHLQNHKGSLSFDCEKLILYSYEEPIAKKMLFNDTEIIYIYKKTKSLGGEFYSRTTSHIIHKLITVCSAYNIDYKLTTEPLEAIIDLETIYDDVEMVNDDCSICLNSLKDDHAVKLNKCNHIFHKGCLDTWIITNLNCPLCRINL